MTAVDEPAPRAEHPVRGGDPVRIQLAITDFPMLLASFRAVIEGDPGMVVVAESPTRTRMTADLVAARPDVVVTACDPREGFACSTAEAIEEIRAVAPGVRIVTLDCRCAADQLERAFRAGANAYLTREAQDSDVVAAIRSVVAGHTYVSPSVMTRMVNEFVRRTDAPPDDPYESLTEREREVLLLAAMGHTNRDIARSLHVTEQTVHYHRANMMDKLGLHDRVELLRYAIRRGVLNPATL